MKKKIAILLLTLTMMVGCASVSAAAEAKEPIKDFAQFTENEVHEIIMNTIENMRETGVDNEVIDSMNFIAYPAMQIVEDKLCSGYVYIYDVNGNKSMSFAQNSFQFENTLYREFGHTLSFKKLGVNGDDWSNVNKIGLQYIKLKDYNEKLDSNSQAELAWEDRIQEWFAEDVRQTLIEEITGLDSLYQGVGPEKNQEVHNFLKKLIFK